MWRLEHNVVILDLDGISATVDLSHPSRGISKITLRDAPLADVTLLRTQGAGFSDEWDESPIDEHVRGGDLFAAYPTNDRRSVRFEIYWRGISMEAAGTVGVELIVSAQTDSLGDDPQVAIGSRIKCDELYRAAGSTNPTWEAMPLDRGGAVGIDGQLVPGLLLYRLPGGEFSYVEMVHPIDFTHGVVTIETAPHPLAHSSLQLFDERLEKGVILRARLQGLFLERADDQQAALDCYRRFRESALPLTT